MSTGNVSTVNLSMAQETIEKLMNHTGYEPLIFKNWPRLVVDQEVAIWRKDNRGGENGKPYYPQLHADPKFVVGRIEHENTRLS